MPFCNVDCKWTYQACYTVASCVFNAVPPVQDTLTKLKWIQSTSMALDPKDPLLAPHVKPILDQLHSKLQHVSAESPNREAASQALMCLHLINSVIHHCIS